MAYKTKTAPRAKPGPKPRTTAVRKFILIEKETVEFMRKLGGGRLGRGIDKAANLLQGQNVRESELKAHFGESAER